MSEVHPGQRVHLELRRTTFVLYTDEGREHIELPYSDADELIEHLTRVLGSDEYIVAETLPPERSPKGHMLKSAPRKLRTVGETRKKMRVICDNCRKGIADPTVRDLSKREFNVYLCASCYEIARKQLFPKGSP